MTTKKTESGLEKKKKNLLRFWKEKPVANPTPEQKKAGWERKRQAQKMMDMVLEYQSMTKEQLEALSNNKNLTILEILMIRYVITGMKDNKMLLDMIDRHVPKAPQKMDIDNNISWGIATIEITGKETMKELEAKRKALLW